MSPTLTKIWLLTSCARPTAHAEHLPDPARRPLSALAPRFNTTVSRLAKHYASTLIGIIKQYGLQRFDQA